ncbi:hypothetical protein K474DRAFT_1754513, partial [Panus rudis PR-1116 ss-1]
YEWISHHNPNIDWRARLINFNRCPDTCIKIRSQEIENDDKVFMLNCNTWIRSLKEKRHHLRVTAMDIAIEQAKQKQKKTFEELVPEQYHEFRDVFEETTFNQLPE